MCDFQRDCSIGYATLEEVYSNIEPGEFGRREPEPASSSFHDQVRESTWWHPPAPLRRFEVGDTPLSGGANLTRISRFDTYAMLNPSEDEDEPIYWIEKKFSECENKYNMNDCVCTLDTFESDSDIIELSCGHIYMDKENVRQYILEKKKCMFRCDITIQERPTEEQEEIVTEETVTEEIVTEETITEETITEENNGLISRAMNYILNRGSSVEISRSNPPPPPSNKPYGYIPGDCDNTLDECTGKYVQSATQYRDARRRYHCDTCSHIITVELFK